jgi:hypothetical protein
MLCAEEAIYEGHHSPAGEMQEPLKEEVEDMGGGALGRFGGFWAGLFFRRH